MSHKCHAFCRVHEPMRKWAARLCRAVYITAGIAIAAVVLSVAMSCTERGEEPLPTGIRAATSASTPPPAPSCEPDTVRIADERHFPNTPNLSLIHI